ncbi:hypothetical protein M9H77_03728 [Catharanthus roseus]|uniref:Uncharacterized protein n=1 Tax=Catharanthus roseus TaxID=4058 RepID=A0ACC0CC85_CATRO|nr:hypothetical protein M9H77_03728 [Catharanthus roseus]
MATHDELVRKILKYQGIDPNLWQVRMMIRVPSFYEDINNDDEMHYVWTIRPNISNEAIHLLVELEPIQSQTFSEVQHTNISTDEDHLNIPQHVMAITHIVFNQSSMLYPDVEEDNDDNDDADEDYDISSESDDDSNPNDEEDDISTPVDHLSSTTANQWKSSQ